MSSVLLKQNFPQSRQPSYHDSRHGTSSASKPCQPTVRVQGKYGPMKTLISLLSSDRNRRRPVPCLSMFTTIDPRASLGIDNIAELLHGTRPSSAPHCVMDTKHQKSGPEADQTKTKKLCPLGLMQPCERRPRLDFALLSGTSHEDPRLSA